MFSENRGWMITADESNTLGVENQEGREIF